MCVIMQQMIQNRRWDDFLATQCFMGQCMIGTYLDVLWLYCSAFPVVSAVNLGTIFCWPLPRLKMVWRSFTKTTRDPLAKKRDRHLRVSSAKDMERAGCGFSAVIGTVGVAAWLNCGKQLPWPMLKVIARPNLWGESTRGNWVWCSWATEAQCKLPSNKLPLQNWRSVSDWFSNRTKLQQNFSTSPEKSLEKTWAPLDPHRRPSPQFD